jgi:glc operon protein GlcG
MRPPLLAAAALGLACLAGASAHAQQAPAQNPLDVIPDKMPFSTPYGEPITLARAQAALQAAVDEAKKRGWEMDVAVVGPSGDLLAFARMDGAQFASIQIAQHKARVAARFRRPSRALEDAVQKSDAKYVLSLDDVVASRGGIPLVENGKLIGAIGCSGGTGSQDEATCTVGAATVNK